MEVALSVAAKWILGLLLGVAPPADYAKRKAIPGWEETEAERRARYDEIAQAVWQVAFDPAEPPLWSGADGRSRTAALLVAIAYHESELAKDVDKGPCYRGGNRTQRCDGGRAACLLQINVGDGKTAEGWTKADLFADRLKCLRAGLRLVRQSFVSCSALPQGFWLNAYASGTCARGYERSQQRMDLAATLVAKNPRSWKDDAAELAKPAAKAPPAR